MIRLIISHKSQNPTPLIASNTSTNNNKKSFVCAGCNESVLAKNKIEFKMIHAQHKQSCLNALFHCPGNDYTFFGMTMEHLRSHDAAYKIYCNKYLSVELSNQNRVHNFSSTGTSFLSNISNSVSQLIMNWDMAACSNTEQADNHAIPSIVDQQGFAHHSNLVGVSSGTVKRGLQNVIFQGTLTTLTSTVYNGHLSNTHQHSDVQSSFDNEDADNESNSNVSSQASLDSDNQSFTMSEEVSVNQVDERKLQCMDKILLNNLKMVSFDSSYVCFLEVESTLRKVLKVTVV